MKAPVLISEGTVKEYFSFEQLEAGMPVGDFNCRIGEYTDYLRDDALDAQIDHVALTWVLLERESVRIAAYMSLIADAVRLSSAEKELHRLNYPFKTIPAIKIAKLAVAEDFRGTYRGLGTYMVYQAGQLALGLNLYYCAARFLTVDADIEHDPGVLAFYEKLGFTPNGEMVHKKNKMLSMRRDLYS